MRIEDLKAASQALSQLENIDAILASGDIYINRARNTSCQWEKVYLVEHSDSSGARIELDEVEKSQLKNLINQIILVRKSAIENTIKSI